VLLGSFLIGILAYAYAFTNKLPNHDDLSAFFGKGATAESGRFGLIPLSWILPNFSMPWIYGILSLFFLALGNCLIVEMFCIRSAVLQFLLGGLIVSFPSQAAIFSYMFTACPYTIAYFLAVLAAFCISQENKKLFPLAALAIVGSVSIYQAYISVTASLLVLFLIRKLILDDAATMALLRKGVLYVCFLGISLGLYWIISKLVLSHSGHTMGSYASDAIGFRVSDIPANIKAAYINCIRVMRYRHFGLITSTAAVYVHFALMGFAGLEFFLYFIRSKDFFRTILLLFLLVMFPLAINCLFLIVSSDAIHTLVLFSYITLYVLFIFLIECGQLRRISAKLLDYLHTAGLEFSVLALAWVMAGNIFVANEASLYMHLSYENTYAFAVNAISQLNTMPEYTLNSPVVIIGEYPSHKYSKQFYNAARLTGVGGLSPDMYSMEFFFDYYIGIPVNLIPADPFLKDADPEVLSHIPSYPAKGHIAKVNDTFVIKLSEPVAE
jgi:hypothetical protein